MSEVVSHKMAERVASNLTESQEDKARLVREIEQIREREVTVRQDILDLQIQIQELREPASSDGAKKSQGVSHGGPNLDQVLDLVKSRVDKEVFI